MTKGLIIKGSINKNVLPLVDELAADSGRFLIAVEKLANGCRLIDAGIKTTGSLEAGRRIAEICLGGLGQVALRSDAASPLFPIRVEVSASPVVLACLGSQYAGWSLSSGEGKNSYRALGSGPARAMGSKEPLFSELGFRDTADHACLVIESDRVPPIELIEAIATDCRITPDRLTIILTPTTSLAGSVQIVARVLETALHKAHSLQFSLDDIIDGTGSAPLAPPTPDALTAMSRTNDAILFAGIVHLFVNGDDAKAEALANTLPSSASRDYGKPFGNVFKAVNYDFFKIDPMLFSPARVAITALQSGRTFHAGKIDEKLLESSFLNRCV